MPHYRRIGSDLERFIAALTIVMGIAALIARNGTGMYQILQETGIRSWASMYMISVGCWTLIISYMQVCALRLMMLLLTGVAWVFLFERFVSHSLWGAALQAGVTVAFITLEGYLIFKRAQ